MENTVNVNQADVTMTERLISKPELVSITGLSYNTLHRMEALGGFPRRLRTAPRRCHWKLSEVLHWIDTRSRTMAPPVCRRKSAA
jgi:predicted DNA-binding transcriptional regulator AlpA